MKSFLYPLLFALFVSIISKAQDEPCDAILLECNVPAITGDFDGATYNPDLLPPGCPGGLPFGSAGDIWFKFDADGEQGYLFYSDFNGQDPDLAVVLYTGEDCNSLTQVRECNIDESFHDVFPAGTYYAQVSPRSGSAADNEYKAGLICSPVPENDERCNATQVSCGNTYTGSFVGSSRTEFVNCYCPSGVGDGGDVWFELNAEPGTTYNIIGQNGQDIEIFDTDGCTGDIAQTSLCCLSQDIFSFSGDGIYYISARPDNLIPRRKIDYQVTIECSTAPINDSPCNAIDVFCDAEAVTGTTVNAGSNESPCSSFGGTPPMVWYKFTSDFEGTMELYLCGEAPTFNATASIYTGNCADLTCYDAGGGCISGPVAFDVSAGETYYFAIHGFGGSNEGEFSLTFQCEEDDFCPNLDLFVGDSCDDDDILTENDQVTINCECSGSPIPDGALCENAIPINENPFFVDYFNPSEFIDPPYYYSFDDIPPFLDSLESDDVSFGCYQANGVVYSFTPDEDCFVDITVTDWISVVPNITILTGCPFTTAHISKGCNDGEFTAKTVDNFYALADTTYYILIDGDPEVFGPFDVRFQMEVKFKKICPESGLQFDPCDDGNPLTINDAINENCECAGTIPPGEFCESALEIIPTPGLTVSPIQIDEGEATFSGAQQCAGVGNARDTWFYFDATTTNMIVGAKGKFSAYDMVLEIYDECGELPFVCKNANGGGAREVKVLTNCIVGETYYVRTYDANGFSPFNKKFFIAVSSLPVTTLDESSCGVTLPLAETISAEIPDYQYPITDWVFEFTELEAPFSAFEFESPNGSSPEITLNQVPGLEAGRNYDVRVKGAIHSGEIFGDYGEACTLSVIGGSGISQLESGSIANEANFEFDLFPNPNDGNEVVVSLTNLTNGRNAAQIRIYDFVGKLVMNHQVNGEGRQMTVRLPLFDIANGVYVVEINVNERPLTAKKLVIR